MHTRTRLTPQLFYRSMDSHHYLISVGHLYLIWVLDSNEIGETWEGRSFPRAKRRPWQIQHEGSYARRSFQNTWAMVFTHQSSFSYRMGIWSSVPKKVMSLVFFDTVYENTKWKCRNIYFVSILHFFRLLLNAFRHAETIDLVERVRNHQSDLKKVHWASSYGQNTTKS